MCGCGRKNASSAAVNRRTTISIPRPVARVEQPVVTARMDVERRKIEKIRRDAIKAKLNK